MLKLGLIVVTLVALTCAQHQTEVWYRWQPLIANPTFVNELYQCVRYNAACNADQSAIRDVLREHVCDNCNNCCIFRRSLVQEVRRKFRELDEENLGNEVEAVDIGEMIQCP